MTQRHGAPHTTRPDGARRSWLRWPSAVLPALLLTATVGLSGGGLAGASSSSAPLVDITVTGAESAAP